MIKTKINLMSKTVAFTLAETLLTLAIIGVVAALTIPSMQDFSDEAKYVASCKKAYSSISNATASLESKYGDLQFWDLSKASVEKKYSEVMNIVNVKQPDYIGKCLDGANGAGSSSWNGCANFSGTANKSFTTADGILWTIFDGGYAEGGAALVDVNGSAPPNIMGVDIFGFRISKTGVFPMGDTVNDDNYKWGCTAYVIKHGKMPWIKDTSYKSCSDGRVQQ